MEGLLLLLALVLGVWLLNLQGRLRSLENRITDLGERLDSGVDTAADAPQVVAPPPPLSVSVPKAVAKASRKSATISGAFASPAIVQPGPVRGEGIEPTQAPSSRIDFEALIGGKLPIWVGGIALAFAGFFLVRYTIEAGLLGPAVRSVLATIFAGLLLIGSQFGGRLPRIGESFSADPRIAQSLAGAGIAILYGTLYMAAETYGLIGTPLAFMLLVMITAGAFALALRHGPPTALMGLVGGFAAPWVAGLGADNVPLLLLYLGIFLAGLFGLALWRRWLWLLLLASGGGALWTIGLVFTAQNALPLLGLFILLAGAAALMVGDRFGDSDPRLAEIARYAPMGLALVQLAMLLPQLQFGWLGWGFYAALSAVAIALAWRDARHLPNMFGALVVSALPLLAGWDAGAATKMMATVTIGFGLLFALPAHVKAAKTLRSERSYWAVAALIAQAQPFAIAYLSLGFSDRSPPDWVWAAIAALLAIPAAAIAWQWRSAESRIDQIVQAVSAALAAAMAWVAAILVIPEDYLASSTILIGAALAAWAMRCSGDGVRRLAIIPIGFGLLFLAIGSWRFYDVLGDSLVGAKLMLSRLPQLGEAARMTLLPSILLAAIAACGWFRLGRRTRVVMWTAALTGLFSCIWLLAKMPFGIDSPSQFISYGLAERVIISQALFAAGWALMRWPRLNPFPGQLLGLGLTGIAVFRLVWFDLGVFNPLWVPQALGPAPIANLGTLHLGLAALWLWLLARQSEGSRLAQPARIGSLILMALTALISVRQLVQGNLVSGALIGTGENYLYSAALLGLAIGWLAMGIRAGIAMLRVAGLALLTLVTFKVFLVDAAALQGVLRILSFLGLGIALIGIGWVYGRVMRRPETQSEQTIG